MSCEACAGQFVWEEQYRKQFLPLYRSCKVFMQVLVSERIQKADFSSMKVLRNSYTPVLV